MTAELSTAPRCSPHFTNAQYVFLITNTDPTRQPQEPDHVPGPDEPPLRFRASRTAEGDRTDVTFYSHVRIDEKYGSAR